MGAGRAPAELSPARTRAVLVVVAVALMTVVSAVSGLNVALPDLARSTGASQTELTWIVDAYTVVFAGLLLFAGALGDRFGRRRLLAVGLVVFGAAALAGSLTEDPTALIAVRALMGLGAAAYDAGDYDLAAQSFQQAVESAPSPDAYRGLVASLQAMGRSEEAGRVGAQAAARYPES